MINILGLIFTAGDILFPITYILNDLFTEVYGFNKSKLINCIIYSIFSWKFCKFDSNVKNKSENRRKIFGVKNYRFNCNLRRFRYINILYQLYL